MARVQRLQYRGEVERHGEATARVPQSGDYALVVRGVPRSVVIRCPSGCGDVLTVNLDRRSGKAWRADMHKDALTLYPSVWRDDGCKAHFIVWRDALLWCDGLGYSARVDDDIVRRVKAALMAAGGAYLHYEDVADQLTLHPWEVLWACRQLQREGAVSVRDRSRFAAAAKKRGWW